MKCQGSVWCALNAVNLEHGHFENMAGVYVIWHGRYEGTEPAVVFIGTGNIKDCILQRRKDKRVQKFEPHGLYVTWAPVPKGKRNGVARYLTEIWKPVASEHPGNVPRVEVNSPWD